MWRSNGYFFTESLVHETINNPSLSGVSMDVFVSVNFNNFNFMTYFQFYDLFSILWQFWINTFKLRKIQNRCLDSDLVWLMQVKNLCCLGGIFNFFLPNISLICSDYEKSLNKRWKLFFWQQNLVLNTGIKALQYKNIFVYQKALIRTFHTNFLTTQLPLWINSTRTQIQKVTLYSKTSFKRSF